MRFIAQDKYLNRYYVHKRQKAHGEYRRFCFYHGFPEISRVPQIYHAWLCYSISTEVFLRQLNLLSDNDIHHMPNLTGTIFAYIPVKAKQFYTRWRDSV